MENIVCVLMSSKIKEVLPALYLSKILATLSGSFFDPVVLSNCGEYLPVRFM